MFHCCRPGQQSTAAPSKVLLRNDSSQSFRHPYLKTLVDLEQKEKLFAAHDLLDDINDKTMESFIDVRIRELLGCNLCDLRDEDLANRICMAFFKQKGILKEWKHKSNLPLFEGLLLAYIFNNMRKIFTKIHEDEIAEDYKKLRDKMDGECTDLLHTCFRDSEERTRLALEINYHPFIHSGECVVHTSHRIRLMEIAYVGKAHKFLAHPACQKAIDRRWQPSYRIGPTSFLLFVYYIAFPLFFFKRTEPYAKNPCETRWKRFKKFHCSPAAKYVVHMVFRCGYVLLYSIVLVRLSRRNLHEQNIYEFPEIFIVMVWQFSYLVEMGVIMLKCKLERWARMNKVDFSRNILIAFNGIFLVAGLVVLKVRFILFPLADLFFYLSYIMAVIRSMRILYVNSFFGSIVAMIGKMVPIMIKFFLIFIFFWGAFAVCYISLSGHYRAENSTYATVPWQLFYHGAFEIFGEAIDEDKKGDLPSCKNFDVYTYTDSSFHCLFRTWMVPILLFTYILISGILLVNILTALLTKQYEDLSKESHIYWKVALYTRLAEYEESLFVPAPLSAIYYIIYYFFIFPCSYVFKKAWNFCRKHRRTRPVDSTSMEMAPLFKDLQPPVPLLARTPPSPPLPLLPPSSSPGNLATIAEKSENIEEVRPFQLKSRDRSANRFYRSHIRPHSAAGMTEHTIEMPSFEEARRGPSSSKPTEEARSTSSSRPRSSEASSPVEGVEDVITRTMQGVRAISQEAERTTEEDALKFIQESRENMIREHNEQRRQALAKQAVMDMIIQKYDLTFTPRQRGMTE